MKKMTLIEYIGSADNYIQQVIKMVSFLGIVDLPDTDIKLRKKLYIALSVASYIALDKDAELNHPIILQCLSFYQYQYLKSYNKEAKEYSMIQLMVEYGSEFNEYLDIFHSHGSQDFWDAIATHFLSQVKKYNSADVENLKAQLISVYLEMKKQVTKYKIVFK
jgi:hypothetical protein